MPVPDAQTRLAVLLGDPVAHSLSPLIHNTAFRTAGVNAVYLATRVPHASLAGAVAGLRALDVLGANVTIPHKQAVLEHLDALTPDARAIGAVNTIVRRDDGTLSGDNTDAAGFLAGLGAEALHRADVLIFGSGGAARAVVYALLTTLAPASLTLAARTPEHAETLAASLAHLDSRRVLRVVPLDEAGPAVRTSRLLVNTTPVGMHPGTDATVWKDMRDVGPGHIVYDLVYAPTETRLLRESAARGATTIGGLAMLVGQAAEAFKQWTGRPMPLDAVNAALHTHLNSSNDRA